MIDVSIMKGWVILRAVRSALREWPIMIVCGVRSVRRRLWISESVVVTGSSLAAVMPEYLNRVRACNLSLLDFNHVAARTESDSQQLVCRASQARPWSQYRPIQLC